MVFRGFRGEKGDVSGAQLLLKSANDGGVIVPDHAKPKEIVLNNALENKSKKNIFRVLEVYDIGSQIMLIGVVESGFLKKMLRTKIRDKKIPVGDIKKGTESVKLLECGAQGTIFLKGKKLNIIRVGDLLEFK